VHEAQEKVRRFCREVIQAPTSTARPEARDATLRARLIVEEAAETAAALVGGSAARGILQEFAGLPLDSELHPVDLGFKRSLRSEPDLVEVIDGLCDLIYVAYGTAEAVGVDLEPYFNAVHASNMAKTGESVDGHGKRGRKPPGWEPPTSEIRRLLDAATASCVVEDVS